MKTVKFLMAGIIITSVVISMSSCKKRKLNRDTSSSKDDAIAENAYNDVFKVVDENAGENATLSSQRTGEAYKLASNCATVTLSPADTVTWPKTLTIDFGNGCTGNDGRTRKGKIIAVFTGKYRTPGTTITITPDNYYVNDHKVEGTKVVKNMGKNSDNHTYYEINVDGKVTKPDGGVITWKSTRIREWIEGENTTFWSNGISGILDDKYKITGSGSGTSANNINYTVTIKEPLILQFCGYIPEIVQGKISIQPEDLKERLIDFGNGSCDNQATLTIGNKTYTFNLK